MAEENAQKIMRTMLHIEYGYFKPFLSSLENLCMSIAGKKALIYDSVTKDCWGFELSLISGMSNRDVRNFLRDFLLKETWDNETASPFYMGKHNNLN